MQSLYNINNIIIQSVMLHLIEWPYSDDYVVVVYGSIFTAIQLAIIVKDIVTLN